MLEPLLAGIVSGQWSDLAFLSQIQYNMWAMVQWDHSGLAYSEGTDIFLNN